MTEKISLMNIPEETQKEILRKNWQSTDGRWQNAMFRELGIEKGNKINKEIAKSVFKGGMHRLLKAFKITKISNIEEFRAIMLAAMELFHAHSFFKYEIEPVSASSVCSIIMRCGTNLSVRKAGIVDMYECGCFACRAGMYNAMGLDVEEKCDKRLLNGDDCCKIIITIKDWE